VFDLADEVGSVDNTYWQLRAEAVPAEEQDMGEGTRLVHCCHVAAPREQPASSGGGGAPPASPAGGTSPAAGANHAPPLVQMLFGDPLLLRIGEQETLQSIKVGRRVALQAKREGGW
jgi:hypothetical protein